MAVFPLYLESRSGWPAGRIGTAGAPALRCLKQSPAAYERIWRVEDAEAGVLYLTKKATALHRLR